MVSTRDLNANHDANGNKDKAKQNIITVGKIIADQQVPTKPL